MKLLSWLKIRKGVKKVKDDIRRYHFLVNDVQDEKYLIYSYKLHSNNYKDLRAFKTQQYESGYLFRNKKGFNTYGFNIKYDVIVANIQGEVLETIQEVEPGFTSQHYENGFYILFTPVGTINYFNLKDRDIISFKSTKMIY